MTLLENAAFRQVDQRRRECVETLKKKPEDYYLTQFSWISRCREAEQLQATRRSVTCRNQRKDSHPVPSGNAFDEDRKKALQQREYRHIAKPFKVETMLEELENGIVIRKPCFQIEEDLGTWSF